MNMYSPPHPGEFIKEVYLDTLEISYRKIAELLNVAPSTFNRLINGQSSISSEMALRLSKTLGRSPESWLIMQNKYNLWHTKKNLNLDNVEKLNFEKKKKQYA
ncbi:MAG: HigA family addiction module antitoxin [Melioribacteraceae bacterium]|jgi:addiction module HigA family antidote|nr:HigA family addiction module antitoxin [Melioribacteraceae bacterium]